MKLFPSKFIKEWDNLSIKQERISAFQLMQRASWLCFKRLKKHLDKSKTIAVCCGPGNNGGDGLLIAAYLYQEGYRVHLFANPESKSPERDLAYDYCIKKQLEIKALVAFNAGCDVIVDALFGHGLERPLEGSYLNLVNTINSASSECISIDIPSGMPSEPQDKTFPDFVQADLVLSFQIPKQTFFLDEYGSKIGRWEIVDIGLAANFDADGVPIWLDEERIKSIYTSKARFSHKGSYGNTLLVGGSEQYPGAIVLTALACLTTGVGKTFVATPPQSTASCLTQAPEAIYLTGQGESLIKSIENHRYTSIAVGPGLGRSSESNHLIQELFRHKSKWIIDADALNSIAETEIAFPEGEVVITPHPGEFDRLTHVHGTTAERWETAKRWSVEKQVVIVLKGAYTSIFFPDGRQFVNSSGNAGLAKGGSGDVLTGLIAGYIGRGYSVYDGVLIAVYLHGLAADEAIRSMSIDALKATDIVSAASRLGKKWEN